MRRTRPHRRVERGEVLEAEAERRELYQTAGIAGAPARVEIAGDDDPNMDHFNDYCFAVEAIEKLGAAYTFDQGSCQFMNL